LYLKCWVEFFLSEAKTLQQAHGSTGRYMHLTNTPTVLFMEVFKFQHLPNHLV
jgi:hypothetical protein